jgi:hypothetical protein
MEAATGAAMSETSVVNIKTGDRFDVYIGRGSKWGNPYRIGQHGTRDQVIAMYRQYVTSSPALLRDLEELRGKRLACFCAPAACHGDVLVELLEAKQAERKMGVVIPDPERMA